MNYLFFFMGFMTGKIIQDIKILVELKEVENEKHISRINRKRKRSGGVIQRIAKNERTIEF